MNIAVLTNDYPPDTQGGAGVIAFKQVEGLRERGHEVRVWNERASWLQRSLLSRLLHHALDIFPRKNIVEGIIAFKPDILITHNLTGLGFGTPSKIKMKTSCRWFHILHDVQLFEPSGSLRNEERVRFWQRMWSKYRQLTFGYPSMIFSPTKWLRDAHLRRGWFKNVLIEVLPNPGPSQEFVLRHPHDPIRLLFLGGTSSTKGFKLIQRLAKRLGKGFIIHVAGDAAHQADTDRLSFYGRLQPHEVGELMKEMDILLVPSQIAENQPTVILEAAAVGLPVIASDIGGVRETLGSAGIVCSPKDLSAWINALERCQDISFYQEQATLMFELSKIFDAAQHLERLNHFCEENRKTRT